MNKRILASAVIASLASAPAMATNGYFSHAFGSKSAGMAGAGSVFSKEALVGATNPASISRVNNRVDFGIQFFEPDREATINVTTPSATQGAQGGNGTYDLNDIENFLMPEFGYVKRLNDKVTAGFLMYGNGGMNTRSKSAIYNGTGTKTGVDLKQLFISPTISWDINEKNSVGVSLNIAYQMFEAYGMGQFAGFTPSGTANNLSDLGHDESYGLGATIGWTGQVTDSLTLGVAYHSRTYMEEFDAYKELFAEQGDFDIPANWTLGLAFQATPKLNVAFDIQHIYYSDVKSLNNPNNMTAANTQLGNDDGKGFGWDDMTIYKLGLEYQATDKLALRAGISHGEQPIGSDDTNFNVIAPAVIEDHATIGFTYTFSSGNEVTGYYMHAFENSVSGTGAHSHTGGGNTAQEIKMNQNAFGVAYSWMLD